MREPRELPEMKTLQLKIVERFLSGKELEDFIKKYKGHKRGWGGSDRYAGLGLPITEAQRKCLSLFLLDGEGKTMRELAEEEGVVVGSIYNNAYRGAVKLLYQNREKLNLKKLLGGGEK